MPDTQSPTPDEFRPLPVTLTHEGHILRQTERNEYAAIYVKSKGDQIRGYEVVRIRRARASVHPHAGPIPPREVYPRNEEWGTHGWTCMTLKDAVERFNRITETQQARNHPAVEATV
jgi:hypothetical protein